MFPIRDHNPSMRVPFITWALIAANIVVFLMYFPELSSNPRALFAFYGEWALVPAEVSTGLERQTLLTSMFLHGGWLHLIMNMLFLYIFGDNIEDQLGHIGFLIFYLAAGVAAAYAQVWADASSTVPVVGASGAIAGVMGGYLLLFPRARVDILVILVVIFRIFTIPAWIVLGLWFALQLVNGAASGAAGGGVAYWAHAGGFIAGVALLLPLWLRRGGPDYWTQTHGAPPHAETRPTGAAAGRDQFADGPIRSYSRESTVPAPIRRDLQSSRIPSAGRRRPAETESQGTTPRGPWSGN
ncbi:MAG: rhomboid family intramembrane serine protease [Pseudomonadota bacterium]